MLLPVFQLPLVTWIGSCGDPCPASFVGAGKEPDGRLNAKSLGQLLWPSNVLQFTREWPDDHDRGVSKILLRCRKQALVNRITEEGLIFRAVTVGRVEPGGFHAGSDDGFG